MNIRICFLIVVMSIFPLLAKALPTGGSTYSWAYHGTEANSAQAYKKPKAPLDGGLSLLAAAGIGYGIKKYKTKKKQQDTIVE